MAKHCDTVSELREHVITQGRVVGHWLDTVYMIYNGIVYGVGAYRGIVNKGTVEQVRAFTTKGNGYRTDDKDGDGTLHV
jgi:hypothetical protein